MNACAEYRKRLSRFCTLSLSELPEQRLPASPSGAQIAAALDREADQLLSRVPKGCRTIALCIEGDSYSSEELSELIQREALHGGLCFLIGGSFGLAERVKASAALRLSMSRMTFPHHLARVMLFEQLYRAFMIAEGNQYHK